MCCAAPRDSQRSEGVVRRLLTFVRSSPALDLARARDRGRPTPPPGRCPAVFRRDAAASPFLSAGLRLRVLDYAPRRRARPLPLEGLRCPLCVNCHAPPAYPGCWPLALLAPPRVSMMPPRRRSCSPCSCCSSPVLAPRRRAPLLLVKTMLRHDARRSGSASPLAGAGHAVDGACTAPQTSRRAITCFSAVRAFRGGPAAQTASRA